MSISSPANARWHAAQIEVASMLFVARCERERYWAEPVMHAAFSSRSLEHAASKRWRNGA